MILISLLIVLSLERVVNQSKYWRADTYLERYHNFAQSRGWFDSNATFWTLAAMVILPPLVLLLAMSDVDNALLELLINCSVLMVCIGCPSLRETYKHYLQAANRGDTEACSLYADQLGHDEDSIATFGQNLVWLNYQHYAAVAIWFVALGPAGAIFYTLARGFQSRLEAQQHPLVEQANSLMAILDFVPVRITALGFLLVGHFSRATPVWLSYLPDPSVPAKQLLADVSRAAEEVEPEEDDCTEEPCTLVKLAKRNIMFLMVVVSALTLSGWVH